MLAALAIRDIVLIDKLDIAFSDGLTALTGETGAGKSILLDALALALGGRGDAGLVRNGTSQGQVTAVFDPPMDHPARALLAENEIEADGDLILRRVQNADGRSRAFVNDQPVGVAMMRRIGASLVEIHGQHDDRALVDASAHRSLLDAFGGLEADAARVAAIHEAVRVAASALKKHQTRIEEARREADFLRTSVEELTQLAPQSGEETELAERRQAMMQAEKIAGDINDAYETISGQASPVPELSGVLRRLERKIPEAPGVLEGVVDALGRAIDSLEDARAGLEAAIAASEFDPRVLEQTEERLFALRGAARKFRVPVEDLSALAAQMAADLADLDAGEEKLAGLEAELADARKAYVKAAKDLSAKRQKTAKALEASVDKELPALKLERAHFSVSIETDEGSESPDGFDTIEFWVQTNPGTRPGPMVKVASGGELARFLLALKVSLADKGSAPTLIFDEIDTGVGGAVAEAIGVRLRRLAERVQVVTVTHAPQVAARANAHLRVSKASVGKEAVATRLDTLGEAERQEEIARMLSGSTVTDEARAAAGKLLIHP
ncbi:DNA repair protein RecN [Rhodobium gokarnense]|uniref:DNA repair protein RecN n=1 Tax=Rhodobium gokarnense TaxID=364296 RepID=A0ABT3H9F3_9HYPH|nr:DNA repair protein RecN [Rhodobium gokarnense]MCW2307025.1 DNA repair protein RecN (Recombination protein N) [Rhodobium gokarnense]